MCRDEGESPRDRSGHLREHWSRPRPVSPSIDSAGHWCPPEAAFDPEATARASLAAEARDDSAAGTNRYKSTRLCPLAEFVLHRLARGGQSDPEEDLPQRQAGPARAGVPLT